jgi:hypothetical protein
MNMTFLKKILLSLTTAVLLAASSPASAQAQVPQAWSGVCVADGVATIQGLQCLVANLLSVAVTAVGFAGFVMLLIGAYRYMISGGNSKGTESAKNTITWAVIGLVVALSSFFIVNLIAQFTGVNTILEFSIPDSSDGL